MFTNSRRPILFSLYQSFLKTHVIFFINFVIVQYRFLTSFKNGTRIYSLKLMYYFLNFMHLLNSTNRIVVLYLTYEQ